MFLKFQEIDCAGLVPPQRDPAEGGIHKYMYYVYIIQNDLNDRFYIGSTCDVNKRLADHNCGKTKSTKNRGFWKLIYKEEFSTNTEARQRENKIKSYKGGNAFKKLIAVVVQR